MSFADNVLNWYHKYGRHNLPWQKNPSPYRVWVSEIMLQQTQVTTVIPYFEKFIKSFPSVKSLACADLDAVLSHWSGLGYYARARNLHKAAKIIHEKYRGRFPKSVEELSSLPGIGRSTAGAIASLSMQIPAAILDGNVKRVITRFYAIEGWPGESKVSKKLWELAEANTPDKDTHHYNQAMMDLGATLCTRTKPNCLRCPLKIDCIAHQIGQETIFPNRKPKKQKPVKQVHSLLIRREDGSLLLQRRPPTGIWGGLWSFPECDFEIDLKDYCKNQLKMKPLNKKHWEKLSHQFSHYTLEINPVLIDISYSPKDLMDSPDLIWYEVGENLPGGISAPVQTLLNRYEEAYEPHDFL